MDLSQSGPPGRGYPGEIPGEIVEHLDERGKSI